MSLRETSAPFPTKQSPGEASTSRSFIEFFAGIGLIHAAIAPFGWAPVFANDIEKNKAATYKLNWPEVPVSEMDIRQLDPDQLPEARMVTASFPCIDLSQAGNRAGIDGQHSGTVWAFLDHVESLHRRGIAPEFIFLENVPGLLWAHAGTSIDLLLRRIASLGYSFDLIQVDARHFVPQARNRVFIIGVLGTNRFQRPTTIPDTSIRRLRVRDVYLRNPNLPWLFFDFPSLPKRELSFGDIIEPLPDNAPQWWDTGRLDYFWGLLEHDHRPRLQQLLETGQPLFMTAVRRLRRRGLREQIFNVRFDGLASCLRTPRGGSSTQYVVQISDSQVSIRRLLGVEAGRLQGVNLSNTEAPFLINGSETEQLFAFGDAVCVPAVRWVIEHSIESLLLGAKAVYRQGTFVI